MQIRYLHFAFEYVRNRYAHQSNQTGTRRPEVGVHPDETEGTCVCVKLPFPCGRLGEQARKPSRLKSRLEIDAHAQFGLV